MGLYRGFDLGIFWWVCDLVLGCGFVIWLWMAMVCGGLVVVGLLVAAMVELRLVVVSGCGCGGFFLL